MATITLLAIIFLREVALLNVVLSAREQLNLSFLLSFFNYLTESLSVLRDIFPEPRFNAAPVCYAVFDQGYVGKSEHKFCSYIKLIFSEIFIKHL